MNTQQTDLYSRVTNKIIADLEQGVRTWAKPWSVEHAAGRITRPLRHNGTPYQGINVLLLWGECMSKGYVAPIWMTYKQAQELKGQVRKGEHGSLVVFANSITKTETNEQGEDTEHEIPFTRFSMSNKWKACPSPTTPSRRTPCRSPSGLPSRAPNSRAQPARD